MVCHNFKMTNNYDFLFKFIIIGDSSVGKSCLLLRFTEGRFKQDHEPTLGVEFGSKNINISDMIVKIQVWDTAGQESFVSITRSYYKSSIAALLVFDVTKRDTFENLNKWLFEVKNNSHDRIEIVVLANKTDLKDKREVTSQEGEKFAATNGFSYYETSAQTGEKVEEAFRVLSEKIVSKVVKSEINVESETSFGIRRGKRQRKDISQESKNIKIGGYDEAQKPYRKCC